MPEPLWKVVQRRQCVYLGGTGETAWRGEEGVDSYPRPYIALESKHRKNRPEWLWKSIEQAVSGKTDDQIPIVMWHFYGYDTHDDVVMLRAEDFVRLLNMIDGS
jgi:hypothetical protein